MVLIIKKVKGKDYYYLHLNYRILKSVKNFSKYIGLKKPISQELTKLEDKFKDEVIFKLSNTKYTCDLLTKDDVIKSLLFKDAFYKKYNSLSPTKRKKYEINSTILFTLTTLTTEDVDVNLNDVAQAYEKDKNFTIRELISKNMIKAVEQIKEKKEFTKKYLLDIHSLTMSSFENKTPGILRTKNVYIHKRDEKNPQGIEISYRPPKPELIDKLLSEFIVWYKESKLNPIEKATLAHYKLYLIHPFLDGNKRTCRLIFNKELLDNGFPLINISDARNKYFDSLIKATENKDLKIFIEFAKEQYFKQINEFLK